VTAAAALLGALAAEGLAALASADPDPDFCPPGTRSLVLIGPMGGAHWWPRVTTAPEWTDGAADPIDRWSKRVLGTLARDVGGAALFPSDGPPWPPFFRWALASGTLWQSPVGMLVHAQAGLWVSFRGALAVPFPVPLPPAASPCASCADKPCVTACPVDALSAQSYDTARCHTHLDTPAGADCLSQGCRARRACPLSHRHARLPEQSAYHMSRFHP
jgi:hypothetical protein